jgi:hypothetical protein
MSLSVNRTSFYTPQKYNKPAFGNEHIIMKVAEHVLRGQREFSPQLVYYATTMSKYNTPPKPPVNVITLLDRVKFLVQECLPKNDVKKSDILGLTVNPDVTEVAERNFHSEQLDDRNFLLKANEQLGSAFEYARELGQRIAAKWTKRAKEQSEYAQKAVEKLAKLHQERGEHMRELIDTY